MRMRVNAMAIVTASAVSSIHGSGANPHDAPNCLLEGVNHPSDCLAPLLSLQGACRAGEVSSLW